MIKKSDKDFQMINPSSNLVFSEYVACEKYENSIVKKPWGFEYWPGPHILNTDSV